MKKIVLLDGNSIMFRAYYATAYTGNLMQTSNGLYTNAIYGFINMINKILEMDDLTHIFVAFDKGKKTFRHVQYSEYKGGRKPMPSEFAMQIPYIKKYLDVLNIKHLELDDFEADDLIGTMSNVVKDCFDEVIVISGDKDLLQLVRENVIVCLTKKGITDLEEYNTTNFVEKMGFTPSQLTDYKALIGDSSDNLKGISGVGPMTAVKLLNSYQTIEGIIENVENIKGKVKESIINDKDVALMTKYLATISLSAPIEYSIDDLKLENPDKQLLHEFFEELEFQSFIKKMNLSVEKESKNKQEISFIINDLDKVLNAFKNNEILSIEVELDKENYHKAEIIGISFSSKKEAYYLDSCYLSNNELIYYIENTSFYTIDSKKTFVSLKNKGININKFSFDLILGAYVVNPSYGNMDIKTIFEKFIETELSYHEEVYGKKAVYDINDIEKIRKYSMKKAYYLIETKDLIDKEIELKDQKYLLYNIELPLAIVLGSVEMNGFKVNKQSLIECGEYLEKEIKKCEALIFQLAGHEFNVGSPKQLSVVLFEELKLGKAKKTKTGFSTSAEVLEELAKEYDIAKHILDYRKYSKLYSTYVVGLLEQASDDSKVHTIFKQALTLTGRLSSTEPNIQNIPVRFEEGRIIRRSFVPSKEDGYLLSADYSQIELRILSALSNCKQMLQAFNDGIDLHTSTAANIFNKNKDDITKDERRIAKAVNFGIVYGMSDWGLSEQLHISPFEADKFIKKYFEVYPEIKEYLAKTVEFAHESGYTKTIYNRRRYINDINSSNVALRKFSERAAMNAPIQGTAADIMKIAMINVFNAFKEENIKSKIVAQVHDELIIDVESDELEKVKQIVKNTMEEALSIGVKLISELEVGKTWDLK